MKIYQALARGASLLAREGVENPRLEVEVLLAAVLDISRAALLSRLRDFLDPLREERFWQMVEQRKKHVPVHYLTGSREFMSLEFSVSPAVLIPRPDTEILVERVLGLPLPPEPLVVDVGTGSGAIAISIAHYLKGSRVYGVDISPEALQVARENARRLAVDVTFVQGNLLEPFFSGNGPALPDAFHVIISNPPYIPTGQLDTLPPEVRHEPLSALDGGPDGLSVYRPLAAQATRVLTKGGFLALEIGFDQAAAVTKILTGNGFRGVSVYRDYAGLDRIIIAQMGEGEVYYDAGGSKSG